MRGRATSFALIGPGRVGSSLAAGLVRAGWECSAIAYTSKERLESQVLRKKFPNTELVDSLDLSNQDFRVLFVAVRDAQIPDVVSKLSSSTRIDWKEKTVLHFSGVAELAVLSKLRKLGASIGALHPISPFAARFSVDRAEHTYYDFLGSDEALITARKITRKLHSKLIRLHSEKERILLHAASVIASNSVVIAVKSAESMLSNFVKPADTGPLLGGLLNSTVDNISRNKRFGALTGPLIRGDLNVVAKHLKALKRDRYLLQFYKSSQLLGIEGLLREEAYRSIRTSLRRMKKLLEE